MFGRVQNDEVWLGLHVLGSFVLLLLLFQNYCMLVLRSNFFWVTKQHDSWGVSWRIGRVRLIRLEFWWRRLAFATFAFVFGKVCKGLQWFWRLLEFLARMLVLLEILASLWGYVGVVLLECCWNLLFCCCLFACFLVVFVGVVAARLEETLPRNVREQINGKYDKQIPPTLPSVVVLESRSGSFLVFSCWFLAVYG